MVDKEEMGASLFSRTLDFMENDPLEEIFALNMGDFVSEFLISEELANKISKSAKDKTTKLKSQLKELVSIYSLDNTLCVLGFDSKDEYVVYNSIAKTLTQILDVDACHIYLTEEFTRGLNFDNKFLGLVGSSIDFDDDIYSKKLGYSKDEKSFIVKAFNTLEKIQIKDVSSIDNFVPKYELREYDVKSLAVVPMHNNAHVVGVIVIENYKEKTIKRAYMNLLETIARLFGTSMHLQKTVEQVEELIADENVVTEELQHMRAELTALIGDLGSNQQSFVERLAKAVDEKGQYKVAHSQRTAELSRKLCKQIGLNEKTTDLVYYAGLLQNIGKITLPESLFANKGKLSKEEWEKLQNHPNVGVNLLMNINFLSEVIPYIHYHKERWDGCGEPEGLKGNSIPFGSRIIAVADAYTAMTSDRSYRDAMSQEEALEIIKSESAVKWDPDVVNALYEVLK
ncbi:MAG: HD domain-containing protein [Cyanobacteria bacterium SIG31]|nr:HD domain-containing protein [Cyanobacteria bacterium SIG31]